MNVALCLATYNDKAGKGRHLLEKMSMSMDYLAGMWPTDNFVVCINSTGFPSPEMEVVRRTILELAQPMNVYWLNTEYPKPPNMGRVREDTCNIIDSQWPDVYIVIDDDFVFRPGAADDYRSILHYMQQHDQCGAVMACSSFGGHNRQPYEIIPTYDALWWTNRGLFLRNTKHLTWRFCTPDFFETPGVTEDMYSVLCRADIGYYTAKMFHVHVTHRHGKVDGDFEKGNQQKGRYSVDEEIHRPDQLAAVEEHVRSKWSDPSWHHFAKRLPKGLQARALPLQTS